jgi:hypothetical protein
METYQHVHPLTRPIVSLIPSGQTAHQYVRIGYTLREYIYVCLHLFSAFRSCTLAYDGQCVTASRVDAVARVDSIEKVDAPWGLGPTDPKLISLPLALLLLALLVRSTLKNNNQPQLQQQPQALAEC